MKKIFVAIPAYTGEIGIHTFHSILLALDEARAQGWEMKIENINSRLGDADVSLARNIFLGKFLESDCNELFFVDADVSWHQDEFTRLFSHDVDFVAAAYRSKTDREGYPVIWPEKKRMEMIDGKPLLEAAGVPFGMARIRRAGLERLIAEWKPPMFENPDVKVKCPWLFEFAFNDNKQRMSEDYTFCTKWRGVGGEVWVDPVIQADHTGKKTYCGNLVEFLRGQTMAGFAQMRDEALRQEMA